MFSNPMFLITEHRHYQPEMVIQRELTPVQEVLKELLNTTKHLQENWVSG
jgi:hypothetical protein